MYPCSAAGLFATAFAMLGIEPSFRRSACRGRRRSGGGRGTRDRVGGGRSRSAAPVVPDEPECAISRDGTVLRGHRRCRPGRGDEELDGCPSGEPRGRPAAGVGPVGCTSTSAGSRAAGGLGDLALAARTLDRLEVGTSASLAPARPPAHGSGAGRVPARPPARLPRTAVPGRHATALVAGRRGRHHDPDGRRDRRRPRG